MNLFVYGTLRYGMHNHRYIAHCEYLGKGTINASLYHRGGLPTAFDIPNSTIIGEVYAVDPITEVFINRLESYRPETPELSLYIPIEKSVQLENGQIITAYVYFFNRPMREDVYQPVPYGDYVKFVEDNKL